ncbi:MAG: isoleucine--tRNA ligase [Rickettsia sp.]|nr:isoleucine--tRNA ligase [Rickettsia sp.]
MFREFTLLDKDYNLSQLETYILNHWDREKIFRKSIDNRPLNKLGNNNEFIFFDGPPFANGLPHYGHLLTGFIKDTVARYQTMRGKRVERVFGWDCHGLPAEMGAEKELKISGRKAILKYGVEKFNDHCRTSVMQYADHWKSYVRRQARWVDFDNSYKTMDTNFMESVLWAFKTLYNKNLVYRDMKVMPYSWACQTALSNFETKLDNSYRERIDKAVTIAFELENIPQILEKLRIDDASNFSCKILAWTTTPWTLPSNLALGVALDMQYIAIIHENNCYIVAAFAKEKILKILALEEKKEVKIIEFLGKNLQGLKYKPIFNYFTNHPNGFQIIPFEFIEANEGTGIVHMAPGFGEEDRIACKSYDIEITCAVDDSGNFTDPISDYKDMNIFDANPIIIKDLKKKKSLIQTEEYKHNYPHCWRTDTPLIYKAVSSWYVKVSAIKDNMVELNKQINWIPNHVKDGLFGKWISNAQDWAISRNRFWGTPIPIWISDDPKYPRIDVYGSIEEIEKDFNVKIHDLHRQFLDKLVRKNPDDPSGKTMMKRIGDVFDCWFESGSMPYGQVHFPFENKKWFENHLPADFIVEYTAQTRGWFYTLMVLSTALFNKPPFLNCICHGVILDGTGRKLSKRLNNYLDPMLVFDQFGSDALRVAMLSSNVVKGEELLIDKEGKLIQNSLRLYIKPLCSAYNFFALYANIDKIIPKEIKQSDNLLDCYILSKLKVTIENIRNSIEKFDIQFSYVILLQFIDVLNNWYIRRNRERFWSNNINQDKIDAFNTLYSCLILIAKAISPILPIIAEYIYLSLKGLDILKLDLPNQDSRELSVHLCDFPDVNLIFYDEDLIKQMDIVRNICNVALALRNKNNIRIRQSLKNIQIFSKNLFVHKVVKNFGFIIQDELNVKEILISSDLNSFTKTKLTINFNLLAKRIPKEIKKILSDYKNNIWTYDKKLNQVFIGENVLLKEEFAFVLQKESKNNIELIEEISTFISLDINLSQDLISEGLARDCIRSIQKARKEADLNITDRINIFVDSIEKNQNLISIIESNKNFIEKQVLGNFILGDCPNDIIKINISFNKQIYNIGLLKIK